MAEPPKRRGPVLLELDDVQPELSRTEPPQPGAQFDPRPDQRDRKPPRTELREGDAAPSPADAPMIDDGLAPLPQPRTMQLVARLVGRCPSRLTRFFTNTGVELFTFLLSVAALRYLTDLLNSYPLLGWIGIGLMVLFCLAALAMAF